MSSSPAASSAEFPTPESGSPFASGRLRHVGLLRFTGADSLSFLQGQLSNDTRRLPKGEPLLAAYSTAQGRVIALLRLLPYSSGIIGLLPSELVAPTLEQMRRFVLRAKVTIEDVTPHYAVAGHHGSEALRAAGVRIPDAAGYVEQDGIGVGRVSSGATRYWLIGPDAQLVGRGLADGARADGALADGHLAGASDAAARIEHDWRLADIRAGLPQIYPATRELFVAQMLNLDLIDGISFTKGCFTGQEIIARTQHLGRIKRRMFRLRLPTGAWAIGQALRLADGRTGRLTELAGADGAFEALAVLNLEE